MKLKMFIFVLILFLFACDKDFAGIECQRDTKLDPEKEKIIINLCDDQETLEYKTVCISETIKASCKKQWVIVHYKAFELEQPDNVTPCLRASKELQKICYGRGWNGIK